MTIYLAQEPSAYADAGKQIRQVQGPRYGLHRSGCLHAGRLMPVTCSRSQDSFGEITLWRRAQVLPLASTWTPSRSRLHSFHLELVALLIRPINFRSTCWFCSVRPDTIGCWSRAVIVRCAKRLNHADGKPDCRSRCNRDSVF